MKLLVSLTTLLLLNLLAGRTEAQAIFLEAHGSARSHWILDQHHYGMSELDYIPVYSVGYGISLGLNWTKSWGVRIGVDRAGAGQSYADGIGLPLIYVSQDVRWVERDVSFEYLYVPMLMRWQKGSDDFRFVLEFGPQLGFQTKAEMQYRVDRVPVPLSEVPGEIFGEELLAEDYFNPVEFGLVVGPGFEWDFSDRFFLHSGAQLYVAATDLNSELTRSSGEYSTSRNAAIYAQAGIGWRLGGKVASSSWPKMKF